MASVMELAQACADVYGAGGASSIWTVAHRFGGPHLDFNAILYRHRKRDQFALAVRGTDGLTDMDDNLAILMRTVPGQLQRTRNAIALARAMPDITADNLFLTGHSLGGGLVCLSAFLIADPLPVVTFNAPGMLRSLVSPAMFINMVQGRVQIYRNNNRKILHIRSEGDLVSFATGPRIGGKLITLPNLLCKPTQSGRLISDFSSRLWTAKDQALCAHRMATMIKLLADHDIFHQEIVWS